MESFGDFLRAQREKKGIRLEELASITKINLQALKYLETNRWDKLPAHPFVCGFITSYAKYVGLDPEDCIDRYKKATQGSLSEEPDPMEMVPPSARVSKSPPTEAGETANQVISASTGLPLGKIAVAGFATVAVVVSVSLIYIGKKDSAPMTLGAAKTIDEEVAALERGLGDIADLGLNEDLPAEKKEVPKPAPAPKKVAAKETSPEPKSKVTNSREGLIQGSARATATVDAEILHRLVIKAKEKTWVKIIVDDHKPMEYFLGKDKMAGYKAKEKIRLVVGDISQVDVTHNSEAADPTKKRGSVAFFVYPPDATFPQDVKPKKPESSEEETDLEEN